MPAVEIVIALPAMARPHDSREDSCRPDHAIVVQHRLTHAHEHYPADRLRRIGLNLDYLIDDFPGGQIRGEIPSVRWRRSGSPARTHLAN